MVSTTVVGGRVGGVEWWGWVGWTHLPEEKDGAGSARREAASLVAGAVFIAGVAPGPCRWPR